MKKKNSFGILERFPTKCTKYFFYFLFRFLLKTKKMNPPFAPPFSLHFGGSSSAASPLEIWDVMPPYLKTLFEQKTRNLIILTIFVHTTPLKNKELLALKFYVHSLLYLKNEKKIIRAPQKSLYPNNR